MYSSSNTQVIKVFELEYPRVWNYSRYSKYSTLSLAHTVDT